MKISNLVRQHWAALRALLVLTVIAGLAYPVFIWLVAQLPGLQNKANGSIIEAGGKPVGSSLIGQSFTDADGNPLPQYFQSRPSAAGDGYDPLATSASNLGPESIVDTPDKPSLLSLVCSRSAAVGEFDGVDGSRPFCTGEGVGAVLSVIGPRDARGDVVAPTRVVSVNEPCESTPTPFVNTYEGVRVECARPGEDYGIGQIVPIRGSAPADPAVPADAVTASGSGLDPHISLAYADLQAKRVAKARGVATELVRQAVADNTDGRPLGFVGQPTVNVLAVNIELDQKYPGG
jgi:potassium-transporting ATPase KdpC subunit